MSFLNSAPVFVEISQGTLKVLDGEDGLDLSLDRQENGRLTPDCIERLTLSLKVFLRPRAWRGRRRALCAVSARGVSLRRLSLPAASPEEIQRLLPLQIEREFPLAPEELAWGCRPLGAKHSPGNGTPAVEELLVAAMKRDLLEEYSQILSDCGLNPLFTLAALARTSLCSNVPGCYTMLDIGRNHSELLHFDGGAPQSIRVLPWGGENLTRAIETALAIPRAEAEKLKSHLDDEAARSPERAQKIQTALAAEIDSLARTLPAKAIGEKLFLSGEGARLKALALELSRAIGTGAQCERVDYALGDGRSAAILGLKRADEQSGAGPSLVLHLADSADADQAAQPAQWKWPALAVLLLAAFVGLRYAEPLLLKPRLVRKIAEIKAYRATLPNIERDLNFLQYLKTNQPPYLEPLLGLANAAPPGLRVESLSMTRRGDFSIRAAMKDPQQMADLRSKLIASGLFSTLVVEEQTPSPDRQKIVVRMTGQWKTGGAPAPGGTAKTNVLATPTNSSARPLSVTAKDASTLTNREPN